MELQVEKYKNLVSHLALKVVNKNGYYTKADLEQELWLKLYEFIKVNSGEEENFPLIKSALRNHLRYLIRDQEVPMKKNLYIEDLILSGVELVYDGFGPYEETELKEVESFINIWFQKQNDYTKRFILEFLQMSGDTGAIHRAGKNLNISVSKSYRIISLLKKFLKKKGVTYVS